MVDEITAWRLLYRALALDLDTFHEASEIGGEDKKNVWVARDVVLDLSERGRRAPKSWVVYSNLKSLGSFCGHDLYEEWVLVDPPALDVHGVQAIISRAREVAQGGDAHF